MYGEELPAALPLRPESSWGCNWNPLDVGGDNLARSRARYSYTIVLHVATFGRAIDTPETCTASSQSVSDRS
jgi:hypothetical protein